MSPITRAQAEALLTLAESLEACERLDMSLCCNGEGAIIYYGSASGPEPEVTAMQIRYIVNALIPKHTGS